MCCSALFRRFSRTDFEAALAAAAAAAPPADWPPRGFEAGEGGAADWAGMGERFVENSPCMLFGHPTIPVSATERETQSVWVHFYACDSALYRGICLQIVNCKITVVFAKKF